MLAAIELGKPVLVEKPIALRSTRLTRCCRHRSAGGNVRVGYSRRYKERYLIAKEQIVKGRIGDTDRRRRRGVQFAFAGAGDAQAQSARHAGGGRANLLRRPDELAARRPQARGDLCRGVKRRVERAGYDVPDVSYAVFTYDDGTVSTSASSYALPEKYPALGHAARVEVLGTEGVMILDDDHTDQLMYSEKGVPHVYLPDHAVNMVFLQSGTPGDWALGEFWGPIANETRAWLDHLATGQALRAGDAAGGARDAGSDAGDRIFDEDWHASLRLPLRAG